MKTNITRGLILAVIACVTMAGSTGKADSDHARAIRHVLLISVDGLHESDLRIWIANHPHGPLARLARRGTTYARALTTAPSDSFPGIIAQLTGGTPYSTGVF